MSEETLPDYELTRRLVEVFSEDADLQSLLYPSWSPAKVNTSDTRIYGAHADIRDPALLLVLPRVIIEATLEENEWEQRDVRRSSPVSVFIHSFAVKEQYHTAELIDARIRTIIGSTYLTNSRIIASELVSHGKRRRFVETRFDDAWRITSGFSAQNVGVLV